MLKYMQSGEQTEISLEPEAFINSFTQIKLSEEFAE